MESSQPPEPFITLSEAVKKQDSTSYATIGVCVEFLPAVMSRGTDYTIKFVLYDPLWRAEHQDHGMQFRFFHRRLECLPAIKTTGDVVILRNVKTKDMGGLVGISNSSTSWIVISASSLDDSTCPNGSDLIFETSGQGVRKTLPPTQAELKYAKQIASFTDPSLYREMTKATSLQVQSIMLENGGTPPSKPDKRRLVRDLKLSDSKAGCFIDGRPAFADLFGEIRKVYSGDYAKVELYLTDYTANPKLYNYSYGAQGKDGDEFDYIGDHTSWAGPWGRQTIKIYCWDAHAAFARANLKEGAYVLIKNCHIKLDPNGAQLEAACRGDRLNEGRVNIIVYQPHEAQGDDHFKSFLKRKEDYMKTAMKQGLPVGRKPGTTKEKRSVQQAELPDDDDNNDSNIPKSKNRKRKDRKRAKQKAAAVDTASKPLSKIGNNNQYVRCNNYNVPLKPIDHILDSEILKRKTQAGNEYNLPFQNCKYKAHVRVVDYYPHNIADFAVPSQIFDDDTLSDHEKDFEEDNDTLRTLANATPDIYKWEWRFVLIVEDATYQPLNAKIPRKQMPLLVASKDADYLLPDLQPCDLRNNTTELAKLKEKMFVLWGDLQERKEEQQVGGIINPSQQTHAVKSRSKPFECYIKEYGLPVAKDRGLRIGEGNLEYHRMFRLWGTSLS